MQDRVAQNPGRVLITPENGSAPFYATMTRADNPTVEGTKINKNALLKDATAALYGLGTDAVPDEVLALIKSVIDENYEELSAVIATAPKIVTGTYKGNGGYGSSSPNTLTFASNPVLVIVGSANYVSYSVSNIVMANGYATEAQTMVPSNSTRNIAIYYKVTNNKISWYSDSGAIQQANQESTTYRYLAFLE